MKILFITNFCPHYHKKPFEELYKIYDIDFIFFSKGENYHNGKNTDSNLDIKFSYLLPGITRPIRLYRKVKNGKYDIIIKCVNGGYLTIYSFILARMVQSKFIFWSNIWFYGKNIRSKIAERIHFFLYKHSDAIVTYGKHIDKFILLNLHKINPKKIFNSFNVVDNSIFNKDINIEEIELLKRNNGSSNNIILLFVGRISEEKGLAYLLDAFDKIIKNFSKISLWIIGEGELKGTYNFNKNITYWGRIRNEELYKYYNASDIFILPSITIKDQKETWGLVINEAMNCGNAIIATNAVGAAVGGLLEDGITGYIVPEKDSNQLKSAIEKLLSNIKLLEEMKIRNKQIIKSFDEKLFVKGFEYAVEYVNGK